MNSVIPASLATLLMGTPSGRLCFVFGAGCSIDAPTGLSTGSAYAAAAHRKLVNAGVLAAGDCADPTDLALLADVVFEKTDPKSQRLLVEQLPQAEFRDAHPNEGHMVAVALLVEQIVGLILTVNIDMALDHAVALVGSKRDISIVHGPKEHNQLGRFGIVYLHGSATAEPDEWILRASQMEGAWRDGWQELLTLQGATMPTVVFAGLGSPAPLLTETIQRVRNAIPGSSEVFQVDRSEYANNRFAQLLGIDASHYLKRDWLTFIHEASRLFAGEHLENLSGRCTEFERLNGLAASPIADVIAALPEDMLVLGRLRAAWFLEKGQYKPLLHLDLDLIADIIASVAFAKQIVGATHMLVVDDAFELRAGHVICRVLSISGSGSKYWAAIERRVNEKAEEWRRRDPDTPVVALLTGVPDADATLAAPLTIVPAIPTHSIMGGAPRFVRLSSSRLRSSPDDLRKAVA